MNVNSGDDSNSISSEDQADGQISNSENEEQVSTLPANNTLKKVKKVVFTNPSKQKTLIHSLLKKARIFEIRKITRRITKLRNRKCVDNEKNKIDNKIDRLLKEMEEMKGFIIESICRRVVNIFNQKSTEEDTILWKAAQSGPNEIEKMISNLAGSTSKASAEEIAFFKILSSKDVVKKFILISQGVNISSRKNKIKSKGKRDIKRISLKTDKITEPAIRSNEEENKKGIAEVNTKVIESNSEKMIKDICNDEKLKLTRATKSEKGKKDQNLQKVINRKKPKTDSFFLSVASHSEDDDIVSEKDEFKAPVLEENKINAPLKSKNRMGQRQRKQLLEKSKNRNFNKGSYNRSPSKKFNNKSLTDKKKNIAEVKKVDESLHPSWVAKQSLKAKQNINVFSGSKIVFDD